MTEHTVGTLRDATLDDVELLANIVARGFAHDPLMAWLFPDPSTRHEHLLTVFRGLSLDVLPDRGMVHLLDDVTASFWRTPDFDHDLPEEIGGSGDADGDGSEPPFPDDVMARIAVLEATIHAVHPREPHWYLSAVATVPERQGQGLGRRVLEPVLARCDAEGTPAYLESTNPKNRGLYRRLGFEDTTELPLPDGPTLLCMWRAPRAPGPSGAEVDDGHVDA